MNTKVEILTEAISWSAALGSFVRELPDVFHFYDYVALEAKRLGGRPVMLLMRCDASFFAIVFILRDIPRQQGLCDATSVYGYNGCLSSAPPSELTKTKVADAFGRALYKLGCVCIFNRGHPFLPAVLPNALKAGETVYVDLVAGESAYDQGLSKGHSYEVRKLKQSGVRIEHDRGLHHLDEFYRAYAATMDRVGASSYYYFGQEYFRQLLTNPALGGELHLAWAGDQLAAGSIFLRSSKLTHYHLSASTPGVTKLPATKLILDEFIRSEIRNGRSEKLHLGGGVGGKIDSLFEFKRAFAGKTVPYYQTRWIIRPVDYANLSAGKTDTDTDTGFFPLYRKLA
jgi:hypothetical protein